MELPSKDAPGGSTGTRPSRTCSCRRWPRSCITAAVSGTHPARCSVLLLPRTRAPVSLGPWWRRSRGRRDEPLANARREPLAGVVLPSSCVCEPAAGARILDATPAQHHHARSEGRGARGERGLQEGGRKDALYRCGPRRGRHRRCSDGTTRLLELSRTLSVH